jgi:hypothetical protein
MEVVNMSKIRISFKDFVMDLGEDISKLNGKQLNELVLKQLQNLKEIPANYTYHDVNNNFIENPTIGKKCMFKYKGKNLLGIITKVNSKTTSVLTIDGGNFSCHEIYEPENDFNISDYNWGNDDCNYYTRVGKLEAKEGDREVICLKSGKNYKAYVINSTAYYNLNREQVNKLLTSYNETKITPVLIKTPNF